MKKLTALLICLILVAAGTVFCWADDLYVIDPYTGEIISSEGGSGVGSVRYSDKCIYNIKEDVYTFKAPGTAGVTVRSNVCDGMVAQGTVSLTVDNTVLVDIYRNGELVSPEDYGMLEETGTYIVRDLANDNQLFSFTIVGRMSGALYNYRLPSGFAVYRATLDGKSISAVNNVISLTEEGEYYIEYGDYRTGRNYQLDLLVDHTPPELAIQGVQENGIAKTTVILGRTEPNSTLTATRNGEDYGLRDELDQPGEYVLTYTDEAGNASMYHFTIRQFFDVSAKLFLLMFLLVVAAAGAYMAYTRRHMRVR